MPFVSEVSGKVSSAMTMSQMFGDAILFPPKFSTVLTLFSMVWYKIVMHPFLEVYHGISHLSLVFFKYTHSPKGSCVYLENTSYT